MESEASSDFCFIRPKRLTKVKENTFPTRGVSLQLNRGSIKIIL